MVISGPSRFLNITIKEQSINVAIETVDKVLNLASRNCLRLLIVRGPNEEWDDDNAKNIRDKNIN